MGLDARILGFLMLSFKPAFSLSSFTFIKRLFSSSSLSAMRVVSSAYLRWLIFLLEILIPAWASSNPEFHMVYSAYKLNKQGDNDNLQPWCTHLPILNQSLVPSSIKEMQIKITMKCHFTPTRTALINQTNISKWWQGCGQIRTLWCCQWQCKVVQAFLERASTFWRSQNSSTYHCVSSSKKTEVSLFGTPPMYLFTRLLTHVINWSSHE